MLNFLPHNYFSFDVLDSEGASVIVETSNNSVYKAKADFGKGFVSNVTGVYTAAATFTNYGSTHTGKVKVFCNLGKVTNLKMDFGTFDGSTNNIARNIILTPAMLHKMPNIKKFYFSFKSNSSTNARLKGDVQGDWSQVPNSLEELELLNVDYPNKTGYINISNFSASSQLRRFVTHDLGRRNLPVYGNLSNLPPLCHTFQVGSFTALNGGITGTIPSQVVRLVINGLNSLSGTLPTVMTYCSLSGGNNTISGTIPTGMTLCAISGSNTLSGTLPNTLTYIEISGNNTISGSLPPNASYVNLQGNNTISGTIPSIVTSLTVGGSNTLSGTLPSILTLLDVSGNNTISGSLPTGLTKCVLLGNNTISGSIPSGITYLNVAGSNTLSGTLPANCPFCIVLGNNTVSGNLPSNAETVSITGNNTISGTIPASVKSLNIIGNNTITHVNTVFVGPMSKINIQASSLTSAMVDLLLQNLAAANWTGEKIVSILGNSGARTSASNAAVATLISKGVSVTTH